MKPEHLKRLRRLIKAHVKTAIESSWIGAGRPEDAPAIELEAALALTKLNAFIAEISAEYPST